MTDSKGTKRPGEGQEEPGAKRHKTSQPPEHRLVKACRDKLAKDKKLPMVLGEREQIMVDIRGRVYTWGVAPQGNMGNFPLNRFGTANVQEEVKHPTPVKALQDEIVRFVCEDEDQDAFFAMTDQKLWAWGTQQNGTLGIGSDAYACYEPTVAVQADKDDALVHVSIGARTGVVLSAKGRVWTWGGWVGVGHKTELTRATRPPGLEGLPIVYARCASHTGSDMLVVTSDGRLLVPGKEDGPWVRTNPTTELLTRLGFSELEAGALMIQML